MSSNSKYILKFLKKLLSLLGILQILKKTLSIGDKHVDDLYKNIFQNNSLMIFDIGVDSGQSINRFNSLFKNSSIYAFEPNKNSYTNLKKKFRFNNIHIFNKALGDTKDNKFFYEMIKSGNSGLFNFNSLSKDFAIRKQVFNNKELVKDKYMIEQIKLDDFFQLNKLKKINILKIDVQGYAPEVLKGAENILKNNLVDIIEVELILSELYEKSNNIYDIEKYLIPNNYKLIAQKKHVYNIKINSPFSMDLVYSNNDIYEKLNSNEKF